MCYCVLLEPSARFFSFHGALSGCQGEIVPIKKQQEVTFPLETVICAFICAVSDFLEHHAYNVPTSLQVPHKLVTWGINVSRWQPNQKQSNEYISDKRYYTLSVSCSCLWKFRRKGMWLKKWGWLTLTEFGKLEIACSTFKVKSIFAFHFWETEVSQSLH